MKFKFLTLGCGVDAKGTQTEGRKFISAKLERVVDATEWSTDNIRTLNFHDAGEIKNPDGTKGFRPADPLFALFMRALKINDTSKISDNDWKPVPPGQQSPFLQPIVDMGKTVSGEVITVYCEPYDIENSQSKDPRRVTDTTLILGEVDDVAIERAFRNRNRVPAPKGSVREAKLKLLAAEINNVNLLAKNERLIAAGKKPILSPETVEYIKNGAKESGSAIDAKARREMHEALKED